ncbi:MAG: glycosyltransferase [Bryobacteraceae bacterium]|nr:glycosyltransferase [Solibacteraceae bacterium]MCO5350073.1 glycosyltransferase [Bryobacteraceae bacterium]
MPVFSVIIPCYHSAATLEACLHSLDGQTFPDFEVILVDSTPTGPAGEDVAKRHDRTRWYHHPERLGAHAARNLAAGMAEGRYLAFMDPDMTAAPDWLDRFRRALEQEGRVVVGGGVDSPPGYWARAVHLTKYGWWLSGGRAKVHSQLPSGNFCLPRALFLEMGGFPDRYWEGDTELSYQLRGRGLELWHLPEARTTHYDAPPLRGFLRERWQRGVDTAQARMTRLGWSGMQRALRVGASPVTWAVMMARSARLAIEAGWGGRWLGAAPVIGVGLAAWVAGEARALAAGRR